MLENIGIPLYNGTVAVYLGEPIQMSAKETYRAVPNDTKSDKLHKGKQRFGKDEKQCPQHSLLLEKSESLQHQQQSQKGKNHTSAGS